GASATGWSRSRRATAARSRATHRTSCVARMRLGTARRPAPPPPWRPRGGRGSAARRARGGRRSARTPRAHPASLRLPPRPREGSSSIFSRSRDLVRGVMMLSRMDSLITAAARALAAGDPLGALNRIALRDDAPALALRGIAMAQLGDLVRAKTLLRRAARAFGPKEAVARARCVVAEADIALVSRDLGWPAKTLDAARA